MQASFFCEIFRAFMRFRCMKKLVHTILILFLFIPLFLISQDEQDLIAWSENRPLSWNDFEDKPDKRSHFDALTSASFGFSYEYLSGKYYNFVIEVGFDKKQSWVKKENATDDLLKHEQGHFDINEIFARLCIKELLNVRVRNMDDFGKKVEKTFNKVGKEMRKFQDEYDRQTNHSKVKEKQLQWNEKIEKLLKQTSEYRNKEIRVEFD